MVTPSLQLAPQPPALDLPPVSKHVRQICGDLLCFWRSVTLTFDLFNWKLALNLLVSWGTFMPILIFLFFFYFRVKSTYETDRQMTYRVRNGCSRSSKVVDFSTNRKRVCDFLLVINSNFGRILPGFRDVAGFLLRTVTSPLFHLNFGAFPLD